MSGPLACPGCGLEQHRSNAECLRCHIPLGDPDKPLDASALSAEARRALGIGAALALVLTWIPITGMLFNPLVTIVHELGHAVTAWLFGYPAIPAFDFGEGGGVTTTFDRAPFLLGVIYALFAGAGWRLRRHVPSLLALGVIVLAYSIVAFGRWHTAAMVGMGHGGELLLMMVFLHRAMSGTTLLQADERPAYAMCAFLIWLHDARFFLSLARNPDTQSWYAEGKSYAENDLTILSADYFNASVSKIAMIYFLLSIVCLVIPWLLYRYESSLAKWRLDALG